ncbi:MAG: hypothetical protein HKO65_01865 [Gemmatimonadetes bacterium]|nr:hypothetical protein [Gemmatimonadota bacterium]
MSQVGDGSGRTPGRFWPLAAVLLMALAIRIAWWAAYVQGINNEGVEYCRLAENLIGGKGYVGIFGGPHVFFPPLFPWLIGAVSFVVHDFETSARVVSLLSGCGIVWAVWGISRRLFSAHVAIVAAVFAAIHPTLVAFSVSAYVEPLYTFLVLTGTYGAMGFVQDRSRRSLMASGVCWGLAYLTRPEAIVGGVMAAGCVALFVYFRERRLFSAARSGAVMGGGMLLLCIPYVIWLSSSAGGFRWEGKSGANSLINERVQQGMPYGEATRGLGGEGGQDGPFLALSDERELLAYSGSGGLNFLGSLLREPLPRVKGTFLDLGRARALGSPWILLLAAAGLLLGLSWRKKPGESIVLVGLIFFFGLVLLLTEWRYLRYFFGTLSILLFCSAAGSVLFARAILLPWRKLRDRAEPASVSVVLAALLLTGLSLRILPATLAESELNQEYSTQSRELGQVIASDHGPGPDPEARPLIMGFGLAPAFYAGGTLAYLPYAEESRALEYVHGMTPDYLILRTLEENQVPYVSSWLETGIPDSCAELIFNAGTASEQRTRIWRWTC